LTDVGSELSIEGNGPKIKKSSLVEIKLE